MSLGLIAVGAFSTGQVLLLGLIGIALFPLCRLLARAQLSGLAFSRRLPNRVFSGERFDIEATVCNTNKHLETSDLSLFDPMADVASQSCPLPFLGCRSSTDLVWMGRLFRRGWNRGNQVVITSRWPLGIFEARLETQFQSSGKGEEGVLVVPRPLTPAFLTKMQGQLERESTRLSATPPDTPSEFRHLREFQAGDAIKSIHWPSSTRSGQLFIKENDPPTPAPGRYGLLVHSFTPPGAVIRNDRFETMLRIATGLILVFQKQDCPVLFASSFSDKQILLAPVRPGVSAILDHIASVPVQFNNELDSALLPLRKLSSCDQVFVLGSAPRSAWETAAREIIPSCVCIDPESLSNGFEGRRIPLIRTASKV